ncbi:hypothetical protein ABZ297_15550 [Nonomuraea sp. NPDC005983]|uniref:hypothetical protein n=1 Tax=Nonomuraea sp. NPDC005983 TaxID=3155595 RepID=UPI0033A2444D
MALITVRLPHGATLADAVERLGLEEQDVDTAYGLVAIDPDEGLYALRVTGESAGRAGQPYADPKIEPFGPPSTA